MTAINKYYNPPPPTDGINEVVRTCRLFVRLVTEEMLTNSTTVRLNNVDTRTFLSQLLYDMFVSALAVIIPTSEQNVYVINIQVGQPGAL